MQKCGCEVSEMREGEPLGITSYPQLLEVMREMVGQLGRDLEATEKKIPMLKANLVRVRRALAVLEGPAKRRAGKPREWGPGKREAAAERMRAMNAARREARLAGGDGRGQAVEAVS